MSYGAVGRSLLRSEPLVCDDSFVGENQPAALAQPDHGFNGIKKMFRSRVRIAEPPVASG